MRAWSPGHSRRQHRVVARVRSVEESGRVLSRPPAHRPNVRCVALVWELLQKIDLTTTLHCCGAAFGVKGLCHMQQCLDPPQQPQSLFRVGFFTDACAALSLAVNILATTLIGYKAWCAHGLPCLTSTYSNDQHRVPYVGYTGDYSEVISTMAPRSRTS